MAETLPVQEYQSSVLDMIGNTPMLEVTCFDTAPCSLFVKLENQNPGGSIKDRIGLYMIEAAERDGRLKPGSTIIEATSGNTGLGLALVARQKGYRLVLVIPDKMSLEKIAHLKAMGAEIQMTRSDVVKGHPEYYQDMAARLEGEIENSFWIDQFKNPANPQAHQEGTGPEIWEQMNNDLDTVVCGVGSGGTLTGIGRFMAEVAPHVKMVLADPEGSVLSELVRSGRMTEPGSWQVEGIGEDFVPPNCDLSLASEVFTISDQESFNTVRVLLRDAGILGGSSSGTLIAAAVKYCQQQNTPKRVVTIVADSGNKYLSKMYNDYWMYDQGFLERRKRGDLRDLIGRPTRRHEVISVQKEDTLWIAYGRMQLYDISQLPVMEDGHIVGIIDESDILLAVTNNEDSFSSPVSEYMAEKLEVISPSAPFHELMPVIRGDRVGIIVDGEEFKGLITRADIINHLRRALKN